MTKKRNTKSALISSVLVLVLCCSMLVGTTFAWFTDEVSSASNVIKTGNLDIAVEYTLDGENWNDLDGATDLFQKGLWEPGHTEVVALKVSNEGTLNLNYAARLNIANEIVGKNKAGEDIVLSDILTVKALAQGVNMFGDAAIQLAFAAQNMGSLWTNVPAKSFKEANIINDHYLAPGDAHYLLIQVDMAEEVGNEANHNGVDIPSIEFGVNVFATQRAVEEDSFGNDYDAQPGLLVTNHDEAQAALNNAKPGDIIQLFPGINYGTLTFTANVGWDADAKAAASTDANTKAVDYFTTKYPNGEFSRMIKDITIIGAPGAIVDGIKFETGTFKVTKPDGKQSGTMYKFVEINNLVIESVEFSDKSNLGAGAGYVSPIFMDLQSVKVDGITVKNCTLEGNKTNMNFVYAYGAAAKDCTFGITLNDVQIIDNNVSGIARLAELREANNVTITGNTVTNTTREMVLCSNNTGAAYTGTITVSGNTCDSIAADYAEAGKAGLFFRVGVGGDATIVVKDNVITNSGCVVDSFASVTEHTGTLTVENNTLG